VLGNVSGVGRTPAFKALVIPKADRYDIKYDIPGSPSSYGLYVDSLVHKGIEFEVLDGRYYRYSDPKKVVDPKVFGDIAKQLIIKPAKPTSSNTRIGNGISSVLGVNADEAERSLAQVLTTDNNVNCMRIDDKYIIDIF